MPNSSSVVRLVFYMMRDLSVGDITFGEIYKKYHFLSNYYTFKHVFQWTPSAWNTIIHLNCDIIINATGCMAKTLMKLSILAAIFDF